MPDAYDLETANQWAEHNLSKALEYVVSKGYSVELNDIAAACSNMTLSTCMSGIGGAELSAHAGALCLEHFLEKRVQPPRTLWACDYSAECRYELRLLPEPPECLFTDVCKCLNPSVASKLKQNASSMRYSDLQKILKHPKLVSTRMPAGVCCVHPERECVAKQATLHAAGTECPAWSAQGAHAGCSGDRVLVWMSWVAHRRAIQEWVVYHENVSEFPLRLLEEELGDIYVVVPAMSAKVCPSKYGQAYERVRRLTIMWHKKFVQVFATEAVVIGSSFEDFCVMARRTCHFNWESYFCLVPEDPELQREIEWSLARPSVKADSKKPTDQRPKRDGWARTAFDRALNDDEVKLGKHSDRSYFLQFFSLANIF